jgi:hypothetical protein
LTPDLITELAKAGVPPLLIAWWVLYSTRPKGEARSEAKEDPAKEMARQMTAMNDKLIRIETMMETLLDRRK